MTHPNTKIHLLTENMDSPQTMSHRKKTLSKAFEETKTEFNSFQTLSRLSMPNDFAPYHTFVHTYVEEANQVNSTFSCIPGNTTQKEKCLTPNTISEQSSPGGVRNMGSLKGCVLLMDDLPQHQTGKMSQLNRHCMSRSSSQRRRRRQRHSQMFPESRSDCASQVCEAKTPSQNEYLDDLKSEIEELAKMQKKLLKKQKKALRTLKKINAAKSA